MSFPVRRWLPVAALVVGLGALAHGDAGSRLEWPTSAMSLRDVPAQLTDAEFWQLSSESSEPGGTFRSLDITNLTSNEMGYQLVLRDLVAAVPPGRVYLGVGPEQNYTYMAALRPSMAVIFDIRRGNLDLQLLYKALFELADDRVAFVAMLFGREKPAGVPAGASVDAIFQAVGAVPPNPKVFAETFARVERRLTKDRALRLPARDLEGIRTVYDAFFKNGFALRAYPTYADLMAATDEMGRARSYLASEQAFSFLKDLQSRNLVIPVVGDFGGPKAIRAIGARLKQMGATVGAFYLSNVEQYLVQDGKWKTFCANVASLPLDERSTFIRSQSGGGGGGFGFRGGNFVSSLGPMREETIGCR